MNESSMRFRSRFSLYVRAPRLLLFSIQRYSRLRLLSYRISLSPSLYLFFFFFDFDSLVCFLRFYAASCSRFSLLFSLVLFSRLLASLALAVRFSS